VPHLFATFRSFRFHSAPCSTWKPPTISLDNTPRPAVLQPAPPKPVQIVQVRNRCRFPGQLKPLPAHKRMRSEPANPSVRVAAANSAARVEPTRSGYLNAIQVYPFSEGALYQVYAAPTKSPTSRSEEGEQLVGSGRSRRAIRFAGSSATRKAGRLSPSASHSHQPTRPDLMTNLIVNTDRRTYHLELHSVANTYMASVSWVMPAISSSHCVSRMQRRARPRLSLPASTSTR